MMSKFLPWRLIVCSLLGATVLAVDLCGQPFVYVTNLNSASVSVIDPTSQRVVASVGTSFTPWQAAVTPDGTRVYVASTFVDMLDAINNTYLGSIPFIPSTAIAITPDGSRVYAGQSGLINIIDTARNRIVGSLPAGFFPSSIVVTGDGSRAYVTDLHDSTLSIFDLRLNQLIAAIPMGEVLRGMAMSRDGTRLYVASTNTSEILVIDTGTNALMQSIPLQCCAMDVAVAQDGRLLATDNQGRVYRIDPALGQVYTLVQLVGGATQIKLTPDGTLAYVANSYANNVTAISVLSGAIQAVIPVGQLPFSIAMGPATIGPPPPPRTISIDIRPGDSTNNISLNGNGTVVVALLSTSDFPLAGRSTVDLTSLRFGRTGTESSLVSCNLDGEDVNKDGLLDLVCRFDIPSSAFQPGDVTGILSGKIFSGIFFTGSDTVQVK